MQPPVMADIEWTWVISAIGSAIVLVTGAIGREWYKVASARWTFDRERRIEDIRAEEKRIAGERKERHDTLDEYKEINDRLRQDIADNRDLVHELRNDNQKLVSENTVIRYRLDVCEWDREDMRSTIQEMAEAMDKAGLHIMQHRQKRPPPMPPSEVSLPGPDSPEGRAS